MPNNENTIDRIQELIDTGTETQLSEELNSYHSADLADIIQQLKPEERLKCFPIIDEEKAADVIEYLPPQLQVEILGDIDTDLASRLISKLPHDEAADVLGDMEEVTSLFRTASKKILIRSSGTFNLQRRYRWRYYDSAGSYCI